MRLGHASGTISFDDVAIDGNPLGSFPGVLNTWQYWTVTDYDFYDGGAGFTLSGTIQRGGAFCGRDEATKVEIVLGVTECGNGAVEAGEDCDDGNTDAGDCCSAQCALEVGACSDGNACTTGDLRRGRHLCAGRCARLQRRHRLRAQDPCDPISGCQHVGAPAVSCYSPSRAVLLIRNDPVADIKDRLIFKWQRSASPPTTAQLAEPTSSAGYSLCVFAGTTARLVTAADLAAGTNWSAIGVKGFRFRDQRRHRMAFGAVLLKSEVARKPRAIVRRPGRTCPRSPAARCRSMRRTSRCAPS